MTNEEKQRRIRQIKARHEDEIIALDTILDGPTGQFGMQGYFLPVFYGLVTFAHHQEIAKALEGIFWMEDEE